MSMPYSEFMRYLALVLSLLLTACAPDTAPVPPHVIGRAIPSVEVAVLLDQAVKYSRYPAPGTLPVIDVIPEALWLKTRCPGLTTETCPLIGYYIGFRPDEAGVIHVRDLPERYNRPYQGVAVHELVHWLQTLNGRAFSSTNCPLLAANEMEAYAVEYVNDLENGHIRAFQMSNVLAECFLALGAKSVRRQ